MSVTPRAANYSPSEIGPRLVATNKDLLEKPIISVLPVATALVLRSWSLVSIEALWLGKPKYGCGVFYRKTSRAVLDMNGPKCKMHLNLVSFATL